MIFILTRSWRWPGLFGRRGGLRQKRTESSGRTVVYYLEASGFSSGKRQIAAGGGVLSVESLSSGASLDHWTIQSVRGQLAGSPSERVLRTGRWQRTRSCGCEGAMELRTKNLEILMLTRGVMVYITRGMSCRPIFRPAFQRPVRILSWRRIRDCEQAGIRRLEGWRTE